MCEGNRLKEDGLLLLLHDEGELYKRIIHKPHNSKHDIAGCSPLFSSPAPLKNKAWKLVGKYNFYLV